MHVYIKQLLADMGLEDWGMNIDAFIAETDEHCKDPRVSNHIKAYIKTDNKLQNLSQKNIFTQ